MKKTSVFWEKTREIPDQAIGLTKGNLVKPGSRECRPGSLLFHSCPSRHCTVPPEGVSPQSLHDGRITVR